MVSRGTIFLGLMLTASLALASLVSQDASDPDIAAPVNEIQGTRHVLDGDRSGLPSALQLGKLGRAEAGGPKHNPFAGKSWYVPPPPPPVAPIVQEVVRPSALKLPFTYIGRLQEEGERAVVFLTQGPVAYTVSEGDEIAGSYRLEKVSQNQLVFVYLPLNTRQALSVGDGLSAAETDSAESGGGTSPDALPQSVAIQDSGVAP